MKKRESGIELLRIILMIGVIILHINSKDIGSALYLVDKYSVSWYLLIFLENIFIYAVDIFIIISGYFLCKSNKRSLIKVIELFLELFFIRLTKYFVMIILGKEIFSISHLLSLFIPNSYFVVLYSVLYIISPYINITINKFNKKSDLKRLLIILIIVFCVWNTLGNIFQNITQKSYMGLSTIGAWGSQQGFNIVNFIILYVVGAYLNINGVKISSKKIYILLISEIILIGWSLLEKIYCQSTIAWYYDNPLIIINSSIIFLIFKNYKKENKYINEIAKASFTVFLVNSIFIGYFIDNIVNSSPLIMVLYIFLLAIGTYIFGYIVYKLYSFISKSIIKLLEKYKEKFDLSL